MTKLDVFFGFIIGSVGMLKNNKELYKNIDR